MMTIKGPKLSLCLPCSFLTGLIDLGLFHTVDKGMKELSEARPGLGRAAFLGAAHTMTLPHPLRG